MEKGIISKLNVPRKFGFITDSNGDEIFFHFNSLNGINRSQLKVGSVLYFEAALTPKGYSAITVKQLNTNHTTPGINRNAKLNHLSKEEIKIIQTLSRIFYITNGGHTFKMGIESKYSYCLLKPTSFFSEQFNLYREIILVFSDYETFEPRTLDAIGKVSSLLPDLRLDRICSILVSKDNEIEDKLKDLLKSNAEMQVIIPFSYNELLVLGSKKGNKDLYDCVINRFRTYFYERDLFAFFAPLQKDLYFFGRQAFVQELVNKYFSHENSGVFGLRRSGKTSVLNAVHRTLDIIEGNWLWLDGQTLSHTRWYQALYYIVNEISKKFGLILKHDLEQYTPEQSALIFEEDLFKCIEQLKNKSILILIDEIEHITFDISLNQNWKSGEDFIYFWQVLRAFYQKYPEKMNFIIAGTNPKAIETARINGYDNPLYKQLQSGQYLEPFSVKETQEMINKLGAYMGMRFDDIVCAEITRDMGGHPFLIRQLCSNINNFIVKKGFKKPFTITHTIYNQVLPQFEQNNMDDYCEMILDVLKITYPEELRMLEAIALDNQSLISSQSGNSAITAHLIGYGIIEKVGEFYSFRNETVKKYILRKNKYRKILKSDPEKWAEISERRNKIEPKLRQIVKIHMRSSFGELDAQKKVINEMIPANQSKYSSLSYNDLFDPKKCEVYFHLMTKIICNNWSVFKNTFNSNKSTFSSYTTIINNLRADCHAASISDDEMLSFRGAMAWFETEIDKIL